MNSTVIQIQNISKKYNISHQPVKNYLALREVISGIFKNRWRFAKKKISASLKKKEEFWALQDINLEVKRGEIIGIIGANGAGKSTLLKILSQITPPTTGEIKIKGKMSSLLEIGTGFHPELTGRENIFLNGAILGMSKKEVVRKFDDIVDFSGVRKFIDTPVKRYSSGMYVRLAFSVAAHMEPDILLVDEVLAVGDAEFQKKCLGKMDEVTRIAGRTILFVSHNMSAIQRLCGRTILLENGKVAAAGDTRTVIEKYLNRNLTPEAVIKYPENKKKKVQITEVRLLDQTGNPSTRLDINESFSIGVSYRLDDDLKSVNMVDLIINDINGSTLVQTFDIDTNENQFLSRERGVYTSCFKFPANIFNEQSCKIKIFCGVPDTEVHWDRQENIDIHFTNSSDFPSKFSNGRGGGFLLKIPCQITKDPASV